MTTTPQTARTRPSPLGRLLIEPRYEVIPVQGVEVKVGTLAPGTTVTVTASPAYGIERTVALAEALADRGYRVVPHLAARMIDGHGELQEIVGRYHAAGIREAFVVGGDATPPAGRYSAAIDLLEDLATIGHPFTRIGIGGYPEGHPLIDDGRLLEALRRKQPYAHHIVTQICFDAVTLTGWVRSLREAGIELPVTVGLPGAVDRRKLAEISLRTGVGASLRYLRWHGREVLALARTRRYDPTPLARAVAANLDEAGLDVAGVHLFTFNQIAETRDWVRRASTARAA